MKISSVVILTAVAVTLAAPASAKTTIIKGEQLCKAAVAAQEPAPKSYRVNKASARVSDGHLWFEVRTRNEANEALDVICTVDRAAGVVSLAPKT